MYPTVVSWSNDSPVRPSYSRTFPCAGSFASSRHLLIYCSVAPSNTGVTAWNPSAAPAQRIEHDLNWRTVGQKWHVLDRQDLGDHAFVTVPPGHLIADRDHPFGCDIDLDHLQHAAPQFVAALHAIERAIPFVDRR